MPLLFLLAILLYLFLASSIGRSARRKGRSGVAWFLIALVILFPAWVIVMAMSPAPAGEPTMPVAIDIPDQIQQLAQLRSTGALSDQEFDAKKAELLARL